MAEMIHWGQAAELLEKKDRECEQAKTICRELLDRQDKDTKIIEEQGKKNHDTEEKPRPEADKGVHRSTGKGHGPKRDGRHCNQNEFNKKDLIIHGTRTVERYGNIPWA